MFYQDRIAELVGAIVEGVQLRVHAAKCSIVDESSQQFVMTGARLVGAGKKCVDHAEAAASSDPAGGYSWS